MHSQGNAIQDLTRRSARETETLHARKRRECVRFRWRQRVARHAGSLANPLSIERCYSHGSMFFV
eukprot:4421125-Pyramimonas_sp.AAC.1